MKYMVLLMLSGILTSVLSAQEADTVVVELGTSSKVILTIGDRKDIDVLRRYDFQALFDDVFKRLQEGDSISGETPAPSPEDHVPFTNPMPEPQAETATVPPGYKAKPRYMGCCKRYRKTSHAFNFDLGINNFIGANGQFPDVDDEQYSVRPWGSWYIGINSVLRTDISRALYIESAVGVSWYNFKFQDEYTLVTEDDEGVIFSQDPRDLDFQKSKLSMTYVNASLIPMIRLGNHHHHHHARFWNAGDGFRIGVGPYVGYRLESHTRQVYEVEGETVDDKDWDNFFLNNLRYGLRMQLGVGDADFFIQYDLNELFAEERGPKLNAFSFGVIF